MKISAGVFSDDVRIVVCPRVGLSLHRTMKSPPVLRLAGYCSEAGRFVQESDATALVRRENLREAVFL